jgi:hypothetical protein
MIAQRDQAWVKGASAEQIVAAQQAGELVSYLGGKTVEEQSHERDVAATPDRVLAEAYGLSSIRGRGDLSSNWFEAKRRSMDATQLEKLNFVESASPADVFSAEQAGDLDHLLGRDVSAEAARLDAVRAATTAAMTNAPK